MTDSKFCWIFKFFLVSIVTAEVRVVKSWASILSVKSVRIPSLWSNTELHSLKATACKLE